MLSATCIAKKPSSGRPRKFAEASRPVTLTLPVRTLRQLCGIHTDRAQAIVKLVDIMAGSDSHPMKPVDVVKISPQTAIIVIGPCKSFRKIPWVRLVEIAPIRYVLSMPPGTPIESLEMAIIDLLETLPPEEDDDRVLLETLRKCISHQRRQKLMSKGELLFIEVE